MNALVDAAILVVSWWTLGLLLIGLWFITVGNAEVPPTLRDELPSNPENAFAGGIACFGWGIHTAARRLR